jgi:hypothetical protein
LREALARTSALAHEIVGQTAKGSAAGYVHEVLAGLVLAQRTSRRTHESHLARFPARLRAAGLTRRLFKGGIQAGVLPHIHDTDFVRSAF